MSKRDGVVHISFAEYRRLCEAEARAEKAEAERDKAINSLFLAEAMLRETEGCAERYRKALLPFAALEPSSLYHEDDLSSDYDPGYVLMLIEDGQRPEITRDDISRARRALADEEGGK